MRRVVYALLIAVCCLGVADVHAGRRPEMTRVYVFGFAASFTDSVACQTSIQQVDSAWLDEHQFLVDRSLYSLQLQYHMESAENCKNSICTVFFDKSEKKLERTWRRVHRRYEKADGLSFRTLPSDRFHFLAEEYRPIVEEEVPDTTPALTKEEKQQLRKMRRRQRLGEAVVGIGEAVVQGVGEAVEGAIDNALSGSSSKSKKKSKGSDSQKTSRRGGRSTR